jgi:hypothetical protein
MQTEFKYDLRGGERGFWLSTVFSTNKLKGEKEKNAEQSKGNCCYRFSSFNGFCYANGISGSSSTTILLYRPRDSTTSRRYSRFNN